MVGLEVGLAVGLIVGVLDGDFVGLLVGSELLGAKEILGAEVISTQLKVPPSNNTHESKISSPTSATTNLIVFHPSLPASPICLGTPLAVSLEVNPSASIL